jgi:S1-C subfamily serine protease
LSGQTVPIETRIRRFHRLTQVSGVLVLDVLERGPAAAAGVRRGDLVLAIGNQPISGVDDLHRALTAERAGQSSALTLLRRADLLSLSVTPGEA